MTSFRLFLGLGLVVPCLGMGCEIHDIAIGGDPAGAGGVGSSDPASNAGNSNQSAPNPCADAACGDPCSTCDPDAAGDCTLIDQWCNADGECTSRDPGCPGGDPSEPVCVSAGCSGQLCVSVENADIATECEWLDEYACYENAPCELQPDGDCGWTPTDELTACIDEARNGSTVPPIGSCENTECGAPCSTCVPDETGGCDDVMEYCNADGECTTDEPQCAGEDPPEPVCVRAGCSGELCVALENADTATDCVWLEEYACYEGASCELLSDGACGWTPTDELTACIDEARNGSTVPPIGSCENAECGTPCSTCVPDETGGCDDVMEYCNADGECTTDEPQCAGEDPPEPVCVSAGCSGQLCVALENADIATDCDWLDEYACYEGASCELQPESEGVCGWTPTDELTSCIEEARNGATVPPADPCANAACGDPCSTCVPDESGGCDDVMEYCNADGECTTDEPQCPGEDPPELACVSAGCSGELCVAAENADIASDCDWLDEYACYEGASCKVQSDGTCGWTPTDELTTCIDEARNGSSVPLTDSCENVECGTACSTCVPDESGGCDDVMEYCNADGECSPDEPQCPDEDTPEPACVSAGCSGELCVAAEDADIASDCEWLDEYACYEGASCEVQADGQCGWTLTDELNACLAEAAGTQ